MKKTVMLLAICLVSVGFIQESHAVCGINIIGGAADFGTLDKDGLSGEDAVQIDFTDTGNEIPFVTVSGKDWKDSNSIVHINGEMTKFSTTDQGTDGAGVNYATKTALNSTDGAITFGVISKAPSFVNSTYWQLSAALQNLPFSGDITQEITFTVTCI